MSERDDDLEALRRELRELRALVNDLRASPAATTMMRTHARCPACDGRKLVYAHDVIADATTGARVPMRIDGGSVWRSTRQGVFECIVCARCGLVEWYVPKIAEVEIDGKRLEVVDGTDPGVGTGGPYR